jgi:hypothetical protein
MTTQADTARRATGLLVRFFLSAAMTSTALGCTAGAPASLPAPPAEQGPFDLAIHSYNYTDNTISSFYVDGRWGGNVFVSQSDAGGGKSACCIRWYDFDTVPKTYRVRWVADACRHQVEIEGQMFDNYKRHWKEQDVELVTPPPARPEFFEVHFYKGGRVEVAITDEYSPPRLILPVDEHGFRPGFRDWPYCTAEQLRTYVDG